MHYRPGIFQPEDDWGNSSTYFEHSVVLSGGTNYYISKYFDNKKQKVKLNGISFKTGIGKGAFNTFFIEFGWIHERFKKFNYNKSFSLELGPQFIYTEYINSNYNTITNVVVSVYLKAQWNWFRKDS